MNTAIPNSNPDPISANAPGNTNGNKVPAAVTPVASAKGTPLENRARMFRQTKGEAIMATPTATHVRETSKGPAFMVFIHATRNVT